MLQMHCDVVMNEMFNLVWSDLTLTDIDNATRVPKQPRLISKTNQDGWRDNNWQGVHFSQLRQIIQRLNTWKDGCLSVV
jgi:hypothetical protein